jgi:hypothetical protein
MPGAVVEVESLRVERTAECAELAREFGKVDHRVGLCASQGEQRDRNSEQKRLHRASPRDGLLCVVLAGFVAQQP